MTNLKNQKVEQWASLNVKAIRQKINVRDILYDIYYVYMLIIYPRLCENMKLRKFRVAKTIYEMRFYMYFIAVNVRKGIINSISISFAHIQFHRAIQAKN